MSVVTLRDDFAQGGSTDPLDLAGQSLVAFHD
jgi:hypothetical protein